MREFYDKNIAGNPEECIYAIFNKLTPPAVEDGSGNYAGVISLSNTKLRTL
jgi:hypothetical protein